jgi:hypothetical protein
LNELLHGHLAGVHRDLTEEKIQEHENVTIVTSLRVAWGEIRDHIAPSDVFEFRQRWQSIRWSNILPLNTQNWLPLRRG